MLDLLEGLESGLYCPVGGSVKLREQIMCIDESMRSQRQLYDSSPGTLPTPSASVYGPSPTNSSSSTMCQSPYLGSEPLFTVPAELFRDWPWIWSLHQGQPPAQTDNYQNPMQP